MTRVDTCCTRCGAPTTAFVCEDCAEPTRSELELSAEFVSEVQTTIARLSRHAERGGRRQADELEAVDWIAGGALRSTPLPVDFGAEQAYTTAATVITAHARLLVKGRGLRVPGWDGYRYAGPVCGVITHPASGLTGPLWNPAPREPAEGRRTADCRHASCVLIRIRASEHPVARAARLVAANLDWFRHRPDAWRLLTALEKAASAIRQVIDAPPPLWYAGPCWEQAGVGRCPGELYAIATSGTVRCPECHFPHAVAARRQWLLKEAVDALAHAEMLAAALSVLDRPITAAMIRGYAHRGRIVAHSVDHLGRPRYRVGDVLQIIEDNAARRAARAAGRVA
jgi:hypothetical protein